MSRRQLIVVAALGLLAGCSSGNGLPAVDGPTSAKLELDASEMRYRPERIAVRAGDIAVVLRNVGIARHDLRVEGKLGLMMIEAAPGQTGTATWRLEKGRYRIFCALAGHRAAGMEGVLEVR